jgi:hypothetical protein
VIAATAVARVAGGVDAAARTARGSGWTLCDAASIRAHLSFGARDPATTAVGDAAPRIHAGTAAKRVALVARGAARSLDANSEPVGRSVAGGFARSAVIDVRRNIHAERAAAREPCAAFLAADAALAHGTGARRRRADIAAGTAVRDGGLELDAGSTAFGEPVGARRRASAFRADFPGSTCEPAFAAIPGI